MASKERQLKRWKNLQQPWLINLSCIICEYTNGNNHKNIMKKTKILLWEKANEYKKIKETFERWKGIIFRL